MSYGIGPMDTIAIGTYVRVGNDFGYVTRAEVVPASNGGRIVLHTISFVEKRKHLYGNKYKMVTRDKPKERSVNYSFIQVVV